VLDKDSVNFKAPESLEFIQLPAADTESTHKKFVWKFGLLLYLLLYKKLPFSFVEANSLSNRDSDSLQINKETIKKFSDHITSRLELLKHQWNPQFDMVNNCLRGALVRDYQKRIRYLDLRALFQEVYNFYQPTPAPLSKPQDPATRQPSITFSGQPPKVSLNPFVRTGDPGRRLRLPQLQRTGRTHHAQELLCA